MSIKKTNSRPRVARKTSKTEQQTGLKRLIWIVSILLVLIIGGAGCGFLSATMQNLPDVQNVQPAASSQIYDVHGNLITTVHASENRLPVPLEQVPKNLQNAFVATEDNRFYSHNGIDPWGILRAVYVNLVHNGVAEGGSTITQQLARNAFLNQDRTLKRKISEALLALQIEKHYTKDEILNMYMNQIYFGQGAYGVQAASHIYFGKDVKDLSLAQAAVLAGLPQSPNYYSPFNNLDASKKRQAVVLGQMVKYGYIDQATADEAKEADLGLIAKGNAEQVHDNPEASYFVDYVINEISKKYGEDAIYKNGYKIYTTIDMDAQHAAVQALQSLPNYHSDENGLTQPQGALVAINPHNGYIVAMVGGRGQDSFNRATQAVRQPGSAFKPFVYLAAIQKGMTPATTVDDSEVWYNGWSPKNYSRHYSGEVTLRYALMHSLNVPAVKIADEVGMNRVLNLAKDLGITTIQDADSNLSSALGGLTQGVIPMELASAYGAFANGGVHVKPTAITKIVDRNGSIIEENSIEEKRVIEEKDAYIITNMLESVISGGTGGNAQIGRPVAGKTGTTDDTKDAWFVGYTPDLVAAVWIGDDSGSEDLHGITGGDLPAIIWNHFMSSALANTPASDFTVPAGVESIANQGHYNPVVAAPEASKEEVKDDKKDKDKKEEEISSDDEDNSPKEQAHKSKRSKKEKKDKD